MGFEVLLIAALGFCNGLRTMTPIAVLCWFAWLGRLHLVGWRGFTAYTVTLCVFTLFALGEYVADKLPNTPSRTRPVGLVARAVFATLVAVLLTQGDPQKVLLACLLGLTGAMIGAYVGWFVRTRSVAALGCPDWPVALLEDGIAIAGSAGLLYLISVR